MFRGVVLTFILFISARLCAQEIDPAYYTYPLEGVARLYSGNFGEHRRDHFHSGVDIKTDGVEGKRVVAAADGYISRIGVSPYGYGLALYVTHPNGTTSVYAHLSKFKEDVEVYVQEQRYKRRENSITLHLKPDEFPASRGELIAYSGNTGSSMGPHLHYEIRQTESQRPINITALRVIAPRDTRRPRFFKLHYIEIDSLDGVAYTTPIRTYETQNVALGEYTLKTPQNRIEVGRKGYFIAEVGDRQDDVTNRFGIYSLEGIIDGQSYFKYRIDCFRFSDTRYVNAVSYYPLKSDSRNELIRMAMVENGTSQFYETILNRGVITSTPAQSSEVTIIATDDAGLCATLQFTIVGSEQSFRAEVCDSTQIVRVGSDFLSTQQAVRVSIPRGALYDSQPFSCTEEVIDTPDSTIMMVSSVYKILDYTTPLHRAMSISIDVDIPLEYQSHVGVGYISKKGDASHVGGTYLAGMVTAESRLAGRFFAFVDITPPLITPLLEQVDNLAEKSSISFDVKDNFSGIKSYEATINGEWVALDYHKGSITHIFIDNPSGEEHTITLHVEDGCGNRSTVEQKFVR